MAINKKRTFKKSSLKTFSFFLIFAAIVWVLVQFSKTYTQLIKIPLVYQNAPLDKSLSDNMPTHVDLQIQDNGFSIYYYRIIKPSLSIDLSEAIQRENTLVYNLQNHLAQIEEELNVDFENSRIIQDEIRISFQFKKEKVIKVIPKIEVNYAVGYSANERVKLEPDSVRVSGPEKIIDSILTVPTKRVTLNNVNQDIEGEVAIDTSDLGMLSFYKNSVTYYQKVEKFTEGKQEIPIKVINVPESLNLAYFPKTVMLYYQVNLENFENVEASDFEVVCDYSEVKEGEDYMIAKVTKEPNFVNNVRLNERRIQFVLKQ